MFSFVANLALLATVHSAHAASVSQAIQLNAPRVAVQNIAAAYPQVFGNPNSASPADTAVPATVDPMAPAKPSDSAGAVMPQPSPINFGTLRQSLLNVLGQFGGVIFAILSGVFIVMMMFAGAKYMLAGGNIKRVDNARASVSHIIEGAFIALGAGLIFGIITLIINGATSTKV